MAHYDPRALPFASQLTTALAHKGSSPAARSVEAAGQLVQLHAPKALE